jgi:hypothetical protein
VAAEGHRIARESHFREGSSGKKRGMHRRQKRKRHSGFPAVLMTNDFQKDVPERRVRQHAPEHSGEPVRLLEKDREAEEVRWKP